MFVFRLTPALLIQFRISHLVFDDLVKSLKMRFPVILANPGSGPGQASKSRVLKQL
jgi:hypothetical protein